MTAPSRNNQQTSRFTTNANSYTLAGYTPTSGTDRMLAVRVSGQRNDEVNFTWGVALGGTSLTEVVTSVDTSSGRIYRVSVFYLVSPATSSADIVATASGGGTLVGAIIDAVTLLGVDTSAALGATATDSDASATTSTLSLTGCAADSLILAAVASTSGGPPTWSWSTATEDYDLAHGSDTHNEIAGSGAYYVATSAGNVSISATRSASALRVVAAAAEFKAAPAEGEGQPFLARTRLVPGMGRPHGWAGW
jgi:hypothetical protein